MARDIEQFKEIIGYEFKDKSLLRQALTHRSYSAEHQLSYDNQRLEFLGDAVLEIILSEYLFKRYPDAQEGKMTKMRSAMVQQHALATLARTIGLGDFFIIGKGERESGGDNRDSSLADLFEAVTGALFLDAGLEQARQFVIPLMEKVFPEPLELLESLNPKGDLQEYAQRRWNCPPVYTVVSISGPDHNPHYEVRVEIEAKGVSATGVAGNRKQAESNAARHLLRMLRQNGKVSGKARKS